MSSVCFCLATYQLQWKNVIKKSTSSGSMATGECPKKKKSCIRVSLFTKITTSKSNNIYQQHIMYWMNPKNCCLQSLPGRDLLNAQYLVPQHHFTACRLLHCKHEVWNMLMALVDSTTFLDISREIRRIESVRSHCLCRSCSEIMKKGILVFLICVLFKSCSCVFWLWKSLLFSKPLSHITWPRLSI